MWIIIYYIAYKWGLSGLAIGANGLRAEAVPDKDRDKP